MTQDIINVISDEELGLLKEVLAVCKKEYVSYKSNDVFDESDLAFSVKLYTKEHQIKLFDGKPVWYKMPYLELRLFADGVDSWGICYKKSDLNRMGVSDSALFRLFKSLDAKYPEASLTLTGIYYSDSKVTFIEE